MREYKIKWKKRTRFFCYHLKQFLIELFYSNNKMMEDIKEEVYTNV